MVTSCSWHVTRVFATCDRETVMSLTRDSYCFIAAGVMTASVLVSTGRGMAI
jgi:hypothetical protein